MNWNTIHFILLILFVTSCSEDFLTKEIPLNEDLSEDEMVVTARMNSEDTIMGLLLYWTYPAFSIGGETRTEIQNVSNAEVTMSGSNGTNYTFQFDTTEHEYLNYFAEAQPPLEAGTEYELSIQHPSGIELKATSQMPPAPEFRSFQWEDSSRFNVERDAYQASLTLDYQVEDAIEYFQYNFYRKISDFDQYAITSSIVPFGIDAANFVFQFESVFVNAGVLGDNQLISKFEMPQNSFENYQSSGDSLNIRVSSITEDDYLFHKSVEEQGQTRFNPFAEAVIIYGNVEGGNGFFSMMNTRRFTIPFQNP